jgi:2-polyprenyl-3-methyl-5-hydroxy-6-metoxy-1,4-benzoquinol methylase
MHARPSPSDERNGSDHQPGHRHSHAGGELTEDEAAAVFEPSGWDERYGGDQQIWSGRPNAQLVAEVSGLEPGTALDVGCGEGGDVVWLAQQGWRVTGADFSRSGLARAARHAAEAGVADRVDWWLVDAREFAADGRLFDLVTTHFLHPPDGGMIDVTRRIAEAVAPGGRLLVVGHAPTPDFTARMPATHLRAMFRATDLLAGLPGDFEVLVAEDRPRVATRDGETLQVSDATLLARRPPAG